MSVMYEGIEKTMNQIDTNHSMLSLTILGSEQSGKSCFLAGLGILSEGDRPSDIMLSSEGESKKMIRDLSAIIRAQEWPAGTTMEHDFIGTLHYKRRDIMLHMVDYAGEQFREGFSGGSELPQNLLNILNNSQFLLLVLDPQVELARDEIMASSHEDRDRYHARFDSLLEALFQKHREQDGKDSFQVGLLITKSDLIEEDLSTPKQAEAYVQKTVPNFYKKLRQEFKHLRTFAVSAVGRTERDANGRMIPAKELEPWGYEHIFDWVLGEIRRKKRKTFIYCSFLVLFFGLLFFGLSWMVISGIQYVRNSRYIDQWNQFVQRGFDESNMDEARRLARKLDSSNYNEQVDRMLETSQKQLNDSSINIKDAEKTRNALRALAGTNNPYRILDLHKMIDQLNSSLEKHYYDSVRSAYKQGTNDDFMKRAQQFMDDYPNSRYREEIEQWLVDKTRSELVNFTQLIYSKSTARKSDVQDKVETIREFINKFPNAPKRAEIENAIKQTTKLIQDTENHKLQIELIRIGKLIDHGYLKLKIFLSGSNNPVVDIESPEKVTEYSFESVKQHPLPWMLGQEIHIELYRYGGIYGFRDYKLVARTTLNGIFALKSLDGSTDLGCVEGGEKYFSDKPNFQCNVLGWEKKDWELLEKWIAPGHAWKDLIP